MLLLRAFTSLGISSLFIIDHYFYLTWNTSSRLYHQFDQILLLARGRQVYSGPGGTAPVRHFGTARPMEEGYNVADYLLEIASEGIDTGVGTAYNGSVSKGARQGSAGVRSRGIREVALRNSAEESDLSGSGKGEVVDELGVGTSAGVGRRGGGKKYAATFLTQVEVLCGREWKNLKRYVSFARFWRRS